LIQLLRREVTLPVLAASEQPYPWTNVAVEEGLARA
jgi:hypothetical protein